MIGRQPPLTPDERALALLAAVTRDIGLRLRTLETRIDKNKAPEKR